MSDSKRKHDFEQLFTDCQRDLLQYVTTLVWNRTDALDVMQETAAALWAKFDEYDPSRPFDVWARQFAHRQVLAYRKRARRDSWRLLQLGDSAIEALVAEYEKHCGVLDDRFQALIECLEKLCEEDYELVQQRYWEKANLRDVAVERGVSDHKLYRQLQRIRLQLQKCVNTSLAEGEI